MTTVDFHPFRWIHRVPAIKNIYGRGGKQVNFRESSDTITVELRWFRGGYEGVSERGGA